MNNLEKAVSAAHTFLKKNPTDPYLIKNMNFYKTLFDVEEHIIDQEEQPYEVCRITLKLLSSGRIKPMLNYPYPHVSLCYPECFREKCGALQQR